MCFASLKAHWADEAPASCHFLQPVRQQIISLGDSGRRGKLIDGGVHFSLFCPLAHFPFLFALFSLNTQR